MPSENTDIANQRVGIANQGPQLFWLSTDKNKTNWSLITTTRKTPGKPTKIMWEIGTVSKKSR
jgi:hypothetical protein